MTGRSAAFFAGWLSTAALATLVLTLAAHAAEPPADGGELAFNNNCRTCHSVKPGDNRLGPSLNGVVGRKAGTGSGFAYSEAMKSAGVVWDEATLDRFIASPDKVVSGSGMATFTGITDAGERSKIIAYLKTQK